MSNQDTESSETTKAHDTAAVEKWQEAEKERRKKKKRKGTTVHAHFGWQQTEAKDRARKAKRSYGKEGRKRHVDIRLIGTRPKVPGRT